MTQYLTWAIVILAVMQPPGDRRFLAIVFAALTQIHASLMTSLDGFSYFGSAALFDFLIMAAAASLPSPTSFTVKIGLICVASMLFNLVGWVLWFSSIGPEVYNGTYAILYLFAVAVFITGDGHGGGAAINRWIAGVSGANSTGNSHAGRGY